MAKRYVAALSLASAIVLASGCSADSADYQAAAAKLIHGLEKDLDRGALNVSCDKPEKSKPQPGDTFGCKATTTDGQVVKFVSTVGEGNKVNVVSTNFLNAQAVTDVEARAVQLLEAQVGQKLGVQNFECGSKGVIVDEATRKLNCILTDPASGRKFDATVTFEQPSDLSRISVEVARTPRT